MSTVSFRKPTKDVAMDLIGRLGGIRAEIAEIARLSWLHFDAGQEIREPLAELGGEIGALASDLARVAEEKRS